MFKKQHLISAFKLCFLFSAAFCIGTMTAHLQKQQSLKAIPTAADGNWGLSFPEEGKTPTGNATSGELSKYNAFYAGNPDKKITLSTFDAGYENGKYCSNPRCAKKHRCPCQLFLSVGNF